MARWNLGITKGIVMKTGEHNLAESNINIARELRKISVMGRSFIVCSVFAYVMLRIIFAFTVSKLYIIPPLQRVDLILCYALSLEPT
jgi:hypothetical protein